MNWFKQLLPRRVNSLMRLSIYISGRRGKAHTRADYIYLSGR